MIWWDLYMYKRREMLIFCMVDRRTINRSTKLPRFKRDISISQELLLQSTLFISSSYSFPNPLSIPIAMLPVYCFFLKRIYIYIYTSKALAPLWPWSCLEVTRWLSSLFTIYTIDEHDFQKTSFKSWHFASFSIFPFF